MLAKCPQQAWRSGTMAGTAHSASCTGSLQQAAWLKRLASLGPVTGGDAFSHWFFFVKASMGRISDCHV
jgi:hypothetical protein